MLIHTEYTTLAGPVIRLQVNADKARKAFRRKHRNDGEQAVAVLCASVVAWNLQAKVSRRVLTELVPVDVPMGCAWSILLALRQ